MKMKLFPAALASAALVALAAGCSRGDDDDGAAVAAQPAQVAPATTTTAPVPSPSSAPAASEAAKFAAKVGDSELGKVMTSADGFTLYGFLNDVDAISTCYSTCAEAWPPVIVDEEWAVGPGLDTGVFSTTEREDGSLQLVAGKFPLYTYGGDAAPGDTTGHGSGDVWFAMNLDGTLIAADATGAAPETTVAVPADSLPANDAEETSEQAPDEPPAVSVAPSPLGDLMVDAGGMTLYGFTNDEDGVPTCTDGCAEAWPPLTVEGTELPPQLDPNLFSLVERPDGTMQLKAGKWPLYRFAGDSAPGDVNGQGSGDVWFAVAPDGKLIK